MPTPLKVRAPLSMKSKVGLGLAGAVATVGGAAALSQTPRGKARRTLYQNRNNPQFKEALTHQIGVNMVAQRLRAQGLDVKVRGEVEKSVLRAVGGGLKPLTAMPFQGAAGALRRTIQGGGGAGQSARNDYRIARDLPYSHPVAGQVRSARPGLALQGAKTRRAQQLGLSKAASHGPLATSMLASGARRGMRLV